MSGTPLDEFYEAMRDVSMPRNSNHQVSLIYQAIKEKHNPAKSPAEMLFPKKADTEVAESTDEGGNDVGSN